MDDFLTKIYHEELEKNASSQQSELFQALGVTNLEDLLGLKKVAVSGPVLPDLSPTMKKGIEAQETAGKETEKHVAQEHSKTETQPERNIAPVTIKQASVEWADQLGRGLAQVSFEMHKNAADEVRPESWYKGQRGIARATRAGDKGLGLVFADPELMGRRLTKSTTQGLVGAGLGAGGLAALGAITGGKKKALLGALLGMGVGGLAGQAHGGYKADKEWLAKKGITPTLLGLGRGRFTPEAAEKYLKEKDSAAMCKAAAVQQGIKLAAQLPEHLRSAIIETTASEMRKAAGLPSALRKFVVPTKKGGGYLSHIRTGQIASGHPQSAQRVIDKAIGKDVAKSVAQGKGMPPYAQYHISNPPKFE